MEQACDQELSLESSPEIERLFAEIRRTFEGRPHELIPMLQIVQRTVGFLPEQALLEIARLTRLSAARVFATATFYAQFHLRPMGKNTIRVCRGTACHVRGGARILRAVEKQLGIKPGETTPDLEFGLETVACMGACALGPAMTINHDTYGMMTTKKVGDVLKNRS
jgi:NADH-quinone oxidoreductase subunit E